MSDGNFVGKGFVYGLFYFSSDEPLKIVRVIFSRALGNEALVQTDNRHRRKGIYVHRTTFAEFQIVG